MVSLANERFLSGTDDRLVPDGDVFMGEAAAGVNTPPGVFTLLPEAGAENGVSGGAFEGGGIWLGINVNTFAPNFFVYTISKH